MKALLEKLPGSNASSFKLFEFSYPYFPTPWHFHPEFELALVTQSQGKKIVGDHVSDFDAGDLCLFGPDLPHTYRNAAEYYAQGSGLTARSIVVQFGNDFLGADFFSIPEMQRISKLFSKAALGLQITGKTRESIDAKLRAMPATAGLSRLFLLLDLLDELSRSDDYSALASVSMVGENVKDNERLNLVYNYALDHFKEPIGLDDVASLTNMTSSAFCRYFSKRTRKTFISFLNEIRIGHACKLLLEKQHTIADIAYESGFNNLSHFNRQFQSIKGVNPSQYKKDIEAGMV